MVLSTDQVKGEGGEKISQIRRANLQEVGLGGPRFLAEGSSQGGKAQYRQMIG